MHPLWSVHTVRLFLLLATICSAFTAPALAAPRADTTPPTIVAEATTAPNANGWYRTNVRVKFTCTDNQRVAFCPAAVVVSSEGANQVVSGTARDKAGNTALR